MISIRDLLLIWLALHLFALPFPDTEVFDEAYYTKAVRDLIKTVPSNTEHPFLGKAWGAIGVLAFGDNFFGWRIPTVVFGLLTLYFFHRITRRYLSERTSLIATALLAFDTIFFAHSGLLLLEVPSLFFAILAIHLYLEGRIWRCAVSLGLSILSKETGILFLLVILILHLTRTQRPNRTQILRFAKFTAILIIVVAAPMQVYDSIYNPSSSQRVIEVISPIVVKDTSGNVLSTTTSTYTRIEKENITNPLFHWHYILTYGSSLRIKEGDPTIGPHNYPWNWIIPPTDQAMPYYDKAVTKNITTYEDGKIVKTKVEVVHPVRWLAVENPIWYTTIIIAAVAATRAWQRKIDEPLKLSISWMAGTYVPLLLISLFLRRIEYPFYFINTIPALALGLTALIESIDTTPRTKNIILGVVTFIVLGFFFYHFPVNIWAQ